MTELEELNRQIDRLKANIEMLELRLSTALTYIDYVLPRQEERKDEQKT
jgi:prefoldin subunit 5